MLTPDSRIDHIRGLCDADRLVFGIREAKGLEFPDVAIVDFFVDMKPALQKPWKQLLRAQGGDGVGTAHPQLEGKLKLLYTAITRCQDRLAFIETQETAAGIAAFRWLIQAEVAEVRDCRSCARAVVFLSPSLPQACCNRSAVGESGLMPGLVSRDEWRVRGIDLSIQGEEIESDADSQKWFQQAITCFERAGDAVLAMRARCQMGTASLKRRLGSTADVGLITRIEEAEVASRVLACMHSSLLADAEGLCDLIIPRLTNRTCELLQSKVSDQLAGLLL